METFGERLQRYRELRHLSQSELARRVGWTSGYVSLIEANKRLVDALPRHDFMVKLAAALEVDIAELAGDTPSADEDRLVAERAVPSLTDAALLLRFGAEVVPQEEAAAALEEFTATALHGRGNLIPQNYDDMRPRAKPRKKKPEPTTFKLRISGDCLAPDVDDGEIVWFDTLLSREPPALVFAVKDEHESHIKRLVSRDGALWLESNDGWSALVDEHWRIGARAFTAQRRLL